MNKTKIEWCDVTINAVVGCKRGCAYCYAKKMNDRFHFVDDFTKPQFFPERLKQIEKIKNKVIFMNSMSDVAFWNLEMINSVEETIIKNPTNIYIFLSKYALHKFEHSLICHHNENCYLGLTIEGHDGVAHYSHMLKDWGTEHHFDFINIEPLLSPIDIRQYKNLFIKKKWIIIGAETGNRKDKVIPKREWIENILTDLKEIGYTGKIFMKDNLKKIYPDMELIQEYPFERGEK